MKSTMFMEEWRDIQGYEGLYQVSNLGKVRSLDMYVNGPSGSKCWRKGRILKPTKKYNGYSQVVLSKKDVQKNCSIHRLVALAFLPNPDNLPQVNHINECKWDNAVWNLEWCTSEYNCNYGNRLERIAETQRKKVNQYTLDGTLVKTWISLSEIGRTLNYRIGVICNCCNNKKKSYKGFKWSYSID